MKRLLTFTWLFLLVMSYAQTKAQNEFITTWQTTSSNESITIPTNATYTYNYTVDWGDGQVAMNLTGDATHTYASAGTYTVKIEGTFPAIFFNNSGDKDKIRTIEQWGTNVWLSMDHAFQGCTQLTYQATDAPDLTSVNSLIATFSGATAFNGAIGNWNTATITDMSDLFYGATAFNQPLGSWNTAAVTTMNNMFREASSFNQAIGDWDVGEATRLLDMFTDASAFDQNLGNWNLEKGYIIENFFTNSGMSSSNYDKMLIAWEKKTLSGPAWWQPYVSLNGGPSYCHCEEARRLIETRSWRFADGGKDCTNKEFITTWRTTSANESITIPTFSGETYNYHVDWGDGNTSATQTGDATHTYTSAGTYMVTITGEFPRIYFNNAGDKAKIRSIEQWGTIAWSSMAHAFEGCVNLTNNATDQPDLREVTDLSSLFKNATSFDANLGSWNVATITTMSNLFDSSGLSEANYDQTLIAWEAQDLQPGVDLGAAALRYCNGATARQAIIDNFSWTVSGDVAFCESESFQTRWQVSSGTITIPTNPAYTYHYTVDWGDGTLETGLTGDATHTYATAGAYTVKIVGDFPAIYVNQSGDVASQLQRIEQWGTIRWKSFDRAFYECVILEYSASDAPDLSEVKSMNRAFSRTSFFNGDLSNWDVSGIDSMSATFESAMAFNGDISNWNVSNVKDMSWMFDNAAQFRRDISGWNVASLENMEGMFESFPFHPLVNLSAWNVSNVKNMRRAFAFSRDFNQDLSNWDVSKVENMDSMLWRSSKFDQNLGAWNPANVTTMDNMFEESAMSADNYDSTLIGWSSKTLQHNVTLGVKDLLYCNAVAERQAIIDNYAWTFDGDIQLCADDAFETIWEVGAHQKSITIPTNPAYAYNYTVDWGDGTVETNFTGDATHTYATAGTYTVKIDGDFPAIYVNNSGNVTFQLQRIAQWGHIRWKSFDRAFFGCSDLEFPASNAPDLSDVNNMNRAFMGVGALHGNLSNWDVSGIDSMSYTFQGASNFTGNLSNWNVSNVKDMSWMFNNASVIVSDIRDWNVSSLENMEGMFDGYQFNPDVSAWNVSNVKNMKWAFTSMFGFNRDLSNWDVSNVRNMQGAFSFSQDFNQDLSNWDVSKVENMEGMFSAASKFNQNLGAWNPANVTAMDRMFNGTAMSADNYDSTLIGWSSKTLQHNVTLGAKDLLFCNAVAERQAIIDNYAWTFDGDIQLCVDDAFETTWETTSNGESITIPTNSAYTYSYTVDWGDGTLETNFTGDATHTYTTAGTYTVKIDGNFPAIYFHGGGDRLKIKTIEQWGRIVWEDLSHAFNGCNGLAVNATDAPDLSQVTSLNNLFKNTGNLTGDLSNWDVSTIQNFAFCFNGSNYNQDISSWDVSNGEGFFGMFWNAPRFNQDISGWNTASAQNFGNMFVNAVDFDQNLGSWKLSTVTNLANMFNNSGMSIARYDSTLIGWASQGPNPNLTLGADGLAYCIGATARQALIDNFTWTFTGDLAFCENEAFQTTWETTTNGESITIPTNSAYTYNYAVDWGDGTFETGFTGDATHTYATAGTYTVKIDGDFPIIYFHGGGDRLKIKTIEQWGSIVWEDLAHAFNGCNGLAINASDAPDLSQVTSLSNVFKNTGNLTGDLSNWDVSTIQNFAFCFNGSNYNQDISTWDVSNGEGFFGMFWNAPRFNQDISSWNTASAQNFGNMFVNAVDFDQNLGSWKLSTVTNFTNMFNNSGMSTLNYDRTLMGWSQLSLSPNETIGVTGLEFCASEIERQKIMDDFNWIFDGDAKDAGCDITTWTGSWDNGVPTASKTALIRSTYTSSSQGAISANHLWVSPGTQLNVLGGNAVTIAGNLNNHGTITVAEESSLIQTANNPDNSGKGTYQYLQEATDFHIAYNYWSSPVQETTINAVFNSTGAFFYTFDASTQSWLDAAQHSTLAAGQGFTATGTSTTATPITRTFSDNTGFNSGTITVTPAFDGVAGVATNNWNLIGNPYPSGLDVGQFLTDNASVLETAVYLWSSDGDDLDADNSDYATMNSLGTVNAGGSGVAPSSATISTCQGFFVQTRASGAITFNNSQRVATNNTFLRTANTGQKLWLNVSMDNEANNELLLGFMEDGLLGKDAYDATKLSGNHHLSFYSMMDELPFAIQGLPPLSDEMEIPLGLEAKSAGTFTFQISKSLNISEGTSIYLFDALTNSHVNLQEETYTIALAAGVYEGRFSLKLIPDQITALAETPQDMGIEIYPKDQQIHIQFRDEQAAQSEISVYDSMGRLLQQQTNQTDLHQTIDIPRSGVWIVHVANHVGKIAKKVLIIH
ncbi:MAG: BspA family leucine-rich repeat surface protein [Flammeovirgaceae bacterium]